MPKESSNYKTENTIKITDDEFKSVNFNSVDMVLERDYSDQLSAYRAKRIWQNVFEDKFLLDDTSDYDITVLSDHSRKKYRIKCEFVSSYGRYAFWRLINRHADDALETMESAHIPAINDDKEFDSTTSFRLENYSLIDNKKISDLNENISYDDFENPLVLKEKNIESVYLKISKKIIKFKNMLLDTFG